MSAAKLVGFVIVPQKPWISARPPEEPAPDTATKSVPAEAPKVTPAAVELATVASQVAAPAPVTADTAKSPTAPSTRSKATLENTRQGIWPRSPALSKEAAMRLIHNTCVDEASYASCGFCLLRDGFTFGSL